VNQVEWLSVLGWCGRCRLVTGSVGNGWWMLLCSVQGLYQSGVGYHLAVSGKSFAAMCDHFPEHLPRVRG